MDIRQGIVENWLQRYTKLSLDSFGDCILLTNFNNYVDIFHGPFALLASYRMPVYSYASDVTCPVTIIASADDEIIPIESSRALFSELSQSNCNFITVEGVLHNDFMSDEQTLNSLRTAIGG